jgi:hypothetical protein
MSRHYRELKLAQKVKQTQAVRTARNRYQHRLARRQQALPGNLFRHPLEEVHGSAIIASRPAWL